MFRAQRKRSRSGTGIKPHADFEKLLEFQMLTAGLPLAKRQFRFAPPRQFPADFAWPEFHLIVEVQGGIWREGGGHSHPVHVERDIEKAQLALLHGWRIFPVTTDEVKNGQALKLIELALQKLGWKP